MKHIREIITTITLTYSLSINATLPRPIQRVPLDRAHYSTGHVGEEEFNKDNIEVLVWNIKKASLKSWRDEFLFLAKDKGLILLQEAYLSHLFNWTTQKFPLRWDMSMSFINLADNNIPTGTMIGSSVQPKSIKALQTNDLEPIIGTPKSTIIAFYSIQNVKHPLMVISIHGINFASNASFIRHMLQIKEEIKKHSGPVLFAGDFNTRNAARSLFMFQVCLELGLDPVNFRDGHLRMRGIDSDYFLDHAFVRGLKVKGAQVIGDSEGSDHKPMLLQLIPKPH